MIALILKIVFFLLTLGGSVHYAQAQGPSFYVAQTNNGAAGDSGLYVYQQFTPTSVHGNRKEFFAIVHDTLFMRQPKVYFYSTHNTAINPTTLLTLDGDGRLCNDSISALIMPQSNVNHLSDSLNIMARSADITTGYINSKIGYVPYSSSNPNGYISGISGSDVTAALSYTPYNNANPASYITGSSATALTNKTGNVSMFSNDASYLTGINSSQVTTALGFTPYNSTNPNGYISSVPAQSFTSITGKPSTLSGYGITDAYPLSGNPSGFLTSVPAQSWISITGKPTFASVATSGSYTDLSNTPTIPAAQVNSDWSSSSGLSQILNKPSFQSPLSGTGFVKISGTTISYDNSTYLTTEVDGSVTNEIELPSQSGKTGKYLKTNGTSVSWDTLNSAIADYANTLPIAGGAGQVIFYLTNDRTSTGTALYSSVTYVNPVVNDVGANYVYGWTISPDKKTLTLSAKSAVPTGVIAVLGISVLGAPVNVANGVSVSILVKGN